jgi:hypothetical protein
VDSIALQRGGGEAESRLEVSATLEASQGSVPLSVTCHWDASGFPVLFFYIAWRGYACKSRGDGAVAPTPRDPRPLTTAANLSLPAFADELTSR